MPTTRASVFALYRRSGHLQYDGEPVTQLDHAWQSLELAREQGASEALQLAAFLHDVGHLYQRSEGSPTVDGVDDRHEATGAATLRAVLPAAVWRPVGLHVAAKRFLVAREPGYAGRLSADSVRSLALQGGPMSDGEVAAFLAEDGAAEAIRLRRWDEAAKSQAVRTPAVDVVLEEVGRLWGAVFA